VPLGLRSVGYACFQPSHASGLRKTSFVQVLWTLEGEGNVRIDGMEYKVPANHAAVCLPQDGHRLSASKDKAWKYRWCTLDGPLAALLCSLLRIPKLPFQAGKCPSELFDALAAQFGNPSPDGERIASIEAYRFMIYLGSRTVSQATASEKEKIGDLISGSSFTPYDRNLNVQAIADTIGLSRFSVHKRFKDELGIAPKRYLDSIRLQKAFSLLREKKMTIMQIAESTGFSNANYFAKFFRKKTGFSPSQFRDEKYMP
jgi:AraC-like DNA-binding protein